jgi:hypothetical protein
VSVSVGVSLSVSALERRNGWAFRLPGPGAPEAQPFRAGARKPFRRSKAAHCGGFLKVQRDMSKLQSYCIFLKIR